MQFQVPLLRLLSDGINIKLLTKPIPHKAEIKIPSR